MMITKMQIIMIRMPARATTSAPFDRAFALPSGVAGCQQYGMLYTIYYTYIYIYIYIDTYVCIYIYIYIHIHIVVLIY